MIKMVIFKKWLLFWMFMDDKITLEKDVFKTLASDTRIKILKILNQRRHTQSELASDLKLAVPTVKEHLDAMSKAGLVNQIDEGYKWKYYELTEKSRCILDPERKKVWILLGFWIVSAIGFVIVFLGGLFSRMFIFGSAQTTSLKALSAQEAVMDSSADIAASTASEPLRAAAPAMNEAMQKGGEFAVQEVAKAPFPYVQVIAISVFIILSIILLIFLFRRRILRRKPK